MSTKKKRKRVGTKRMGKNAGRGNTRERERRRLFIALYTHPDYARNGTKAATDAGYSAKSAHVQASRMLADPNIRAEIDAELARQIERTKVTSEIVVKELANIGRANLRDLLEIRAVKKGRSIRQELFLKTDSLDRLHPDLTAAIRELEPTKDGIRVRLHDKIPALMGLSKWMGGHFRDPMLAPPKPQYTTEQRVALMIGLLRVLGKRQQEAIAAGKTA